MALGLVTALPMLLWQWASGTDQPQHLQHFQTDLMNVLVVVLAQVFQSGLRQFSSSRQRSLWWLLFAPFVGINLLWPLDQLSTQAHWVNYLAGLGMNALGFITVLSVLHARYNLLRSAQTLREQALTDPLTGLSNRRQFDLDLNGLGAGGVLVLLDIDHFKQVNDRYGHAVGDRVLQGVGHLLSSKGGCRTRAYRVGGEEFALLISLGSEAQARAEVEAVLGRIAAEGLLLAGTPPVEGLEGMENASITLSAGLAQRQQGALPKELYRRADQALYLAKTNGRNRLVSSSSLGGPEFQAQQQALAATPPAQKPADNLKPRFMLWQALRGTLDLLSQRRSVTQDDWAELLRLAIACVDGAEAGSLHILEGRSFRVCAVAGVDPTALNLRLSQTTARRWYAQEEGWREGRARVLTRPQFPAVWQSVDALSPGTEFPPMLNAHRRHLRANLCQPVVLGGRVVGHLNLESYSDEAAFGEGSSEVAGMFAQQLAALLQMQRHWHELDLLADLNMRVYNDEARLPHPTPEFSSVFGSDHSPQQEAAQDTEHRDEQDGPPHDHHLQAHLTETALDLLGARQAVLLRYIPEHDSLEAQASAGPPHNLGAIYFGRGQGGRSWQALDTGQVVCVDDARSDQHIYRHGEMRHDAMMLVPLLNAHKTLGVLVLVREASRPFLTADIHLGMMLAGIGTRLLERHAHLSDLHLSLEAALTTLGMALEVRNFETQGHTHRVQRHALTFGRALGLCEEQLTDLRHGAALHDIGKLAIPDAVLLKPARLDAEERRIVETHASIGAQLATRIPHLNAEAVALIRSHHERWDGHGYPEHLVGEEIPLLARLFNLCDVHDALICARPYKAPIAPEQAIDIIGQGRGTQFDPHLTDLFVKLWKAGEFR
ncbi:bifunctional diguanylate cyclase/phosphohydrolase [Deinococcus arenicola]|uniref:Diguanylate cyclase n=1 Tax=Deinococcus arenicola TaxID=2994950 RepID=A0ABU4DQV2_9DEIO|nr:HD domain-containing phosphohydrolase [Deinococcus sp. ZS9-10]MDV6374816.1 diguanylate cyclase [Deinococcus sp. ZS9-10]